MPQLTCWFSDEDLALIDRLSTEMRTSKAEVVRTVWRAALTIFPDLRETVVLRMEQEKAHLTTEIAQVKEGIVKNPITMPEPAFRRPGQKTVKTPLREGRELFLHFVGKLNEPNVSEGLKRVAVKKCREQIDLHPEWIEDVPDECRSLIQEVGD